MDQLAPPLAHDFNEDRRGSWTGDFEPSRRTSFSNSFLETPPALEKRTPRFPQGSMYRIPLDEEADLMGTPPISPVVGRSSRPVASYFDTPTRETPVRKSVVKEEEQQDSSLFSTLLSKAFETVSKSGEAMDVHGRDVVDLAAERRAAKGKARAIPYDEFDEPPAPTTPMRATHAENATYAGRNTRPTSIDSTVRSVGETKIAPTAATREAEKISQDDRDFYATHPFEAGLVDVLEATEKKVSEWWSWLSQDAPTNKV